ncbi:hypothetical protein PV08_07300 [Exophiala spinifera]|uniref:PNPLA domain-containing protein n=1 Tax=Exophiala spinifera TaxID=91928 RepID=A0A0D1YHZ9_9EURO|nr:uncharacterized protein PV08_07300 [Exophiala spinifera]KIW14516.1 hypothetical protein PV08_07300 [Exophiala spinifera]
MYENEIKLLSCDGGGVRGVSGLLTLLVLTQVEVASTAAVSMGPGLIRSEPSPLVVSRLLLDLVARTSTTGIIATVFANLNKLLIDVPNELSYILSQLLIFPGIPKTQFTVVNRPAFGVPTFDKICGREKYRATDMLRTMRILTEAIDHLTGETRFRNNIVHQGEKT